MRRIAFLLTLLAAQAALGSTNAVPANRILMVGSSSAPIGGGEATLILGALKRADGVYAGDYKIKISPYFWKNETGTIAIVVSDESMARINQGKAAAVQGAATTSGKSGKRRRIDATATPTDMNGGRLKLWFVAGDRKMIFEPAYHFTDKRTAANLPPINETNLASLLP